MRVFFILIIAHSIAFSNALAADISKRWFVGQYKKVVYFGKCSTSAQSTDTIEDSPGTRTIYYAVISIDEIKLDNMPDIRIFVFTDIGSDRMGWIDLIHKRSSPPLYHFLEGKCLLQWKSVHSNWGAYISFDDFKIFVKYEPELQIENTGTGTSLKLELTGPTEGKKIQGYKIYRREKTID